MEISTVTGGNGVNLHVREWGKKNGKPILFVHGWSQHHLAFHRQVESDLANEFRLVAFDLRGHGMSDAPTEVEAYADGDLWAADIAAIIEQLGLVNPLLVGWSFGGFVISDYLRVHGDAKIAGVNYVGWGVIMGNTEEELRFVGRGFHDYYQGAISKDVPTAIKALRGFVHACLGKAIPQDDLETMIAFNVMVPQFTRWAMTLREAIDFTPVISELSVPILASYGTKDTVALPIAGEHIVNVCKNATSSFYEGAGHAPFLEEPERFNQELANFTRQAQP
ncbi:MAG: alpha/beta hydrolase [Rhizobiales bacterium]|nr:alpha/beta hydrolase [Hyphomicrobiales bacterium]